MVYAWIGCKKPGLLSSSEIGEDPDSDTDRIVGDVTRGLFGRVPRDCEACGYPKDGSEDATVDRLRSATLSEELTPAKAIYPAT